MFHLFKQVIRMEKRIFWRHLLVFFKERITISELLPIC